MIPTAYFRWVRIYDHPYPCKLQQWWYVNIPNDDDGGFSCGEWIDVILEDETDIPPDINKYGEQ